jgi:hypothetical protein
MKTIFVRLVLALALVLLSGVIEFGPVHGQFKTRPNPGLPPPAFPQPKIPQPPNIPSLRDQQINYRCRRCGYQVTLPFTAPTPTCPNCSATGGGGLINPVEAATTVVTSFVVVMVAGGLLFVGVLVTVIVLVTRSSGPPPIRRRRPAMDLD